MSVTQQLDRIASELHELADKNPMDFVYSELMHRLLQSIESRGYSHHDAQQYVRQQMRNVTPTCPY